MFLFFVALIVPLGGGLVTRGPTIQNEAKAAGRGLWRDPSPGPPWEWRRGSARSGNKRAPIYRRNNSVNPGCYKAGTVPIGAGRTEHSLQRREMDSTPITEADLLKMPTQQYMNQVQLAFFRDRLLALKREIAQNASATSDNLRSTEFQIDPSDRATQEEEHSIELRVRDRERKLLRKIDQALARIDDGSYGYCEETGEPIGLRRLLARPTATLSVEAQQRRERRERVYAG